MSIFYVFATVCLFILAIGIVYAAYSYKLSPCDKKHS